MALRTAGTSGNNVLSAFIVGTDDPVDATVALLNLGIKDDQINTHPIVNQAYIRQGVLYVPNRGYLRCINGDMIAFDPATGWPILVSARAAGQNPQWIHS